MLTAILLMAAASDRAGEGAWLLLIYSLGIGVPFLIAAGVLIFTGQMPAIAFWLIETFPALGKLG